MERQNGLVFSLRGETDFFTSTVVKDLPKLHWIAAGKTWVKLSTDAAPFDETPVTKDEIRLLEALAKRRGLSNAAALCANVRSVLKANSVEFGQVAVDRVSGIVHHKAAHSSTIAETFLPVVADDGQTAVIVDGRAWGPLAGLGLIIKLEHQSDGSWQATKTMPLWVS